MFTLHRSRLGSQSQWLHWESESGNVKEPLLGIAKLYIPSQGKKTPYHWRIQVGVQESIHFYAVLGGETGQMIGWCHHFWAPLPPPSKKKKKRKTHIIGGSKKWASRNPFIFVQFSAEMWPNGYFVSSLLHPPPKFTQTK